MLINDSRPGQTVTLSNPDGRVIGLYRFQETTSLSLTGLQGYSLTIDYGDEKNSFLVEDRGDFKWTGTNDGILSLTFESATFGDAFSGLANSTGVAIKYDIDGDAG